MHIREQDKEQIIAIAMKTLKQPCILWAYGSRVSGESHDTSDLDMVLISKDESKINQRDFNNFIDALQNSNIPILIQVLDWQRIPESFHKNILSNHEELLSVCYE